MKWPRGTDGWSFFWAVLFFTAIAAVLIAGVCVKYRVAGGEIPDRYLPERIQPIVVEGIFAVLTERPAPARWDAHYPNACYGWLRDVCWWALVDVGIGPLTEAPTGELWLRVMDRMLRNEGSWGGVLRPDCVGLRCAYIPNPDGSLDRGAAAFNDRWSRDVPDAVAFHVVRAVRQVARDWASPGGRWPGSWCGLNWPGGC